MDDDDWEMTGGDEANEIYLNLQKLNKFMGGGCMNIEIGQYREKNKGALKAFFSMLMKPMGIKILDCRYFVQGDRRWFSFPQKEVKFTDGRKTEYIPYVSIMDKELLEQIKVDALKLLKVEEEKNGQKGEGAQVGSGGVSNPGSEGRYEAPF